MSDQAKTDNRRVIWIGEGDLPDEVFVTDGGGIGMNIGGDVIVMTARRWHGLAGAARMFGALSFLDEVESDEEAT